MKTSSLEAAYEPMRAWALSPSPIRPPGVAQLFRGGMITWAREMHPLPDGPSREVHQTSLTSCCATPLSAIVAAMIVGVAQ